MSLDLSTLLTQPSLPRPRRPVAEQMLSIQVRDVRPLVEVNQQTIRIPQMGDSLSLLWRWRSGGCLGPEAAAALNARQRQARDNRPAADPPLVRQGDCPDARLWACRRCYQVPYARRNSLGPATSAAPAVWPDQCPTRMGRGSSRATFSSLLAELFGLQGMLLPHAPFDS